MEATVSSDEFQEKKAEIKHYPLSLGNIQNFLQLIIWKK